MKRARPYKTWTADERIGGSVIARSVRNPALICDARIFPVSWSSGEQIEVTAGAMADEKHLLTDPLEAA